MTEPASDPARPRGQYGVDGDYRLIPAPVIFGGYLVLCISAAVLATVWLIGGRTLPGVAGCRGCRRAGRRGCQYFSLQ